MKDIMIIAMCSTSLIVLSWILLSIKEYNNLPKFNVLDMYLDLNEFSGELFYISLKDIYEGKTDYYSTNNFVFYKSDHYPYSFTFGLTESKTSQHVISTSEDTLNEMIKDIKEKQNSDLIFEKAIYQIQFKGSDIVNTDQGQIDLNEYSELEYLGFDNEITIDSKTYKLRG